MLVLRALQEIKLFPWVSSHINPNGVQVHHAGVTHIAVRTGRVEKIEGGKKGGDCKGTELFYGHSSCFFLGRQAEYAVHCIATC